MNRMMRFSGAAVGMVLLAGLAHYQGRVDVTRGEQDVLAGTALIESPESQEIDCENTAELNRQEVEDCSDKLASSDAD
jgi:hypothetical protein